MIKHLLQIIIVLAIVMLSLGVAVGLVEYVEEGERGLLMLSGIGVILWMPTLVLIIKYINEEDEDE